jgi:transcriptional regulator with XRE-family HTH domain
MAKPRAPAPESLFAYILRQLEEWKGKWQAVADGSGVSYRTLEKIARGETVDPGIKTCEKLADFFRANSKELA